MELIYGIEIRHTYIIKLTQQPYFKLYASSYCSDVGISGLNPTWDMYACTFLFVSSWPCRGPTPVQKVKVKAVLVHALKVYTGRRGIGPLILNLGTRRWRVVNIMPQLLYSHPVPIEQESGWAPQPFRTFDRWEKSITQPKFKPRPTSV